MTNPCHARRPSRRLDLLLLVAALGLGLLTLACDDDGSGDEPDTTVPSDTTEDTEVTEVTLDDELGLDVVVESSTMAGLDQAATDMVDAFAGIRGATTTESHVVTSIDEVDAAAYVRVVVDASTQDAVGEQGYRLVPNVDAGSGRTGIEVHAATEVGAMYGLYDLQARMGVRYFHPEQTWMPSDAEATLPVLEGEVVEQPDYEFRGYHEHTQHPLPWADYYMIADDAHRPWLTRYFQWLARNRQNAASYMMLKTVDEETWIPYITEVIAEAHTYGIQVGFVISFADQQQNGYKLVADSAADEATQIRDGIDRLAGTGIDFLTIQLATSEFTQPTDARALGWLDTAMTHARENWPELEMSNWIHIACDVKDEQGDYYFHIPLRADVDWTSWVHTTMYYTLEHPAPVYECEDFTHQIDYMNAADGQGRRQIFFPETAWWLGFDNNMPVALPITGWSRDYDIAEVISEHEFSGHITFTSGREWHYWQYDHHVAQQAWDTSVGWSEYLDWVAPIYGSSSAEAVTAINAITDLQVRDFYETNPLIYFYVAGELSQDELGEVAGVLARRPKLAYRKVFEMDDAAFAEWESSDLDLLRKMAVDYAAVVDAMPTATTGTDLEVALYRELRASFELFVLRLNHAITLYEGVAEARVWRLEQLAAIAEGRDPDTTLFDSAMAATQAKLDAARAMSAEALAIIQEIEAHYRYPLDLLTAPRQNLTSYKFGYLHETSTAHFWTRRDDQLASFMTRAFDQSNDAWITEPDSLYLTNGSLTTMLVPDDPVASGVIAGFVPRLLFGLSGYDADAGTMDLFLAEDVNVNLLPDEGTLIETSGTVDTDSTWTATLDSWPLRVLDDAGKEIGTLPILDADLSLSLETDGPLVLDLKSGELVGDVLSADLLALVAEVGGIDEEGATNLIKNIYDVPEEDPLPERLPVHFRFRYELAE